MPPLPLISATSNLYAYTVSDSEDNFDSIYQGKEDFVGDLTGGIVTASFTVTFSTIFPGYSLTAVAVAATSGCVGNMVGQLATDDMKDQESSVEDLFWSCASGAVSGSLL